MSSIPPSTLRKMIHDTLNPLGLWSLDAEELLMATCAQESLLGTYRTQIHGPARGIFQMEAGDFDDIWENYLKYKTSLAAQITHLNNDKIGNVNDLINNDSYAIAMTRVHYMRAPKSLPSASDLNGLWMYYKVNYNSVNGAAKMGDFYSNYHRFVTDGVAK